LPLFEKLKNYLVVSAMLPKIIWIIIIHLPDFMKQVWDGFKK